MWDGFSLEPLRRCILGPAADVAGGWGIAQAVLQQVGVMLGAAQQGDGLAPVPAAAATRIHRLLAAKLEDLRQGAGAGAAARRPSETSSGALGYMQNMS